METAKAPSADEDHKTGPTALEVDTVLRFLLSERSNIECVSV